MAMKQQTFAYHSSFEKYGRKSRRELFLDETEVVVLWSELQALVEPHYQKAGNGRRPVGLAIMLRTYFMQQWFNLSDPGVEEAFYKSATLRQFAGVDLGVAPAPDETTVLRFRHLLDKHDLGGAMLDTVNLHLAVKGIRIETGTIVDATRVQELCRSPKGTLRTPNLVKPSNPVQNANPRVGIDEFSRKKLAGSPGPT
jgi:IS5 family transposase